MNEINTTKIRGVKPYPCESVRVDLGSTLDAISTLVGVYSHPQRCDEFLLDCGSLGDDEVQALGELLELDGSWAIPGDGFIHFWK